MVCIYFKEAENSPEKLKKNKVVNTCFMKPYRGDWSLPPLILNLGPRKG